MKLNHCFFVSHVFRHNNPHLQKLQNWADLRQISVSDTFIITTSISFSCINIRFLNLIIIITTKIPLGLVVYRSKPGMTVNCANDSLATTAHRSHVPQTCAVRFCFIRLRQLAVIA